MKGIYGVKKQIGITELRSSEEDRRENQNGQNQKWHLESKYENCICGNFCLAKPAEMYPKWKKTD